MYINLPKQYNTMEFEKLVAVSGKPGLFFVVGNRSNGLILEDIDSKKRTFVPARTHQFSPLETISIYVDTDEETVPLRSVFAKMRDADVELVSHKGSKEELRAYFLQILPEHDQDQVSASDIGKVVKWFGFLKDRQLLHILDAPAVDATADAAEVEEVK